MKISGKKFSTPEEAVRYAKRDKANRLAIMACGAYLVISRKSEDALIASGGGFAYLGTIVRDNREIVVTVPVDGPQTERRPE